MVQIKHSSIFFFSLKADNFLSHMVQIKQYVHRKAGEGGKNFLSHMVQIKQVIAMQSKLLNLPFYPIWFR